MLLSPQLIASIYLYMYRKVNDFVAAGLDCRLVDGPSHKPSRISH